jgi:predicted TIM-barrel fold metal-dependent hydrolase
VPVFSESATSHAVKIPPPAFKVEHTRSNPDRSARVHDKKYKGPIIDTHVHLDPPPRDEDIDASELEEIIKIIKNSGVEFAIFMPTPNEGRRYNHEEGVKQKRMLLHSGRDRIKLFCESNYITYWLHIAYQYGYSEEDLENILKRLSRDLDSGECAGIGEIGVYHFRKHGRQKVIQYPPNFVPFLRIVDLLAKKGKWLDLHAEPVTPEGQSFEKQVFGGIELLFRRNPDLKLILSHSAMTNPVNVRRILLKYPNVMMNIKIVRKHHKWRNFEPITNPEGELYEDWAQLFEEMPERFMIGTDSKFGRKSFETSKYKKKIKRIRHILGALTPRAARLIAYENARKLFK